MRVYNNNLQLNIGTATNQLSPDIINISDIPTADLYDPSTNFWQHHYDTNSDNSSDYGITMEDYLPDEFTDEPNNNEERQRSASSGQTGIDHMMAGVTIGIGENSQVVYAYTNNQLVYTESVQTKFLTNVETQVPFIHSSSNMSEQTPQYENIQPPIPIEAQSTDFYRNIGDYAIADNHTSMGSTSMQSDNACNVSATQQQLTPQTPIDFDTIGELNFSCFSYGAVDPCATPIVHDLALTDGAPNLYECTSMTVGYHKQNNLNAPPSSMSNRMGIDRHRTQSLSEMFNTSLGQITHSTLVHTSSAPNVSQVKYKRNMDNTQRPKKKEGSNPKKLKPPTAKEKREMLENDRQYLECSNEDLRSQVYYLEIEISKMKDFCLRNGWIPHDFEFDSN